MFPAAATHSPDTYETIRRKQDAFCCFVQPRNQEWREDGAGWRGYRAARGASDQQLALEGNKEVDGLFLNVSDLPVLLCAGNIFPLCVFLNRFL